MRFEQLLTTVGHEPVFESSLLFTDDAKPADIHRQLSRWTRAGQLIQLRHGLYALAPSYQRIKPHPFVIANALVQPSYISCQSVLAYYGLIPEYVPKIISVTTAQAGRWLLAGAYLFHKINSAMLFGYQLTKLETGQQAFVASPEKALLDLIYLTPNGDNPAYLRQLRLQELGQLNLASLQQLALRMQSPKLRRAAEIVTELAYIEAEEYETL